MLSNIIGFVLTVFLVVFFACQKGKDCRIVSVTNSAPGCGGWGIVINNKKYPSKNIPDQFKQDGIAVCAEYSIYDDAALCACCGGKWASIKSMQYPGD